MRFRISQAAYPCGLPFVQQRKIMLLLMIPDGLVIAVLLVFLAVMFYGHALNTGWF